MINNNNNNHNNHNNKNNNIDNNDNNIDHNNNDNDSNSNNKNSNTNSDKFIYNNKKERCILITMMKIMRKIKIIIIKTLLKEKQNKKTTNKQIQ